MSKELNQITFEFSDADPKKEPVQEFLSGKELPGPKKSKSTRGRKSVKEGAEEAKDVAVPDEEILNSKQYYGIGEVAAMFGVNTSLLRSWEAEFGMSLRKNRKGDRFYTPADIKNLQLIHDLVRRRKFTIDGARDFLKQNKLADERYALIQSLQKLKGFLQELKAHL